MLASLLLSLVSWPWQGDLNNDAVVYLDAAAALRTEGLAASIAIYPWPLYPALIAAGSELGLSSIVAARLINSVLFALLCGAFAAAAAQLWHRRVVAPLMATLLILALPELNELRHEVLRDGGYLAFLLLSLVCLLHYNRRPALGPWMGWAGCVMLAALFRIEAILVFALAPLGLVCHRHLRGRALLQLAIMLVAALAAWWFAGGLRESTRLADLGRWAGYLRDLGENFEATASAFGEVALETYSRKWAREGLVAAFLAVFVGVTLKGLTLLHGYFAWRGWKLTAEWSAGVRTIVLAYLVATGLPALLFIAHYHFLTQRYVFGLVLLLALLAVGGWHELTQRQRGNPRVLALLALLVLILAGASVRKLVHDDFLLRAAALLEPASRVVWTNDKVVGHYLAAAGHTVVLAHAAPAAVGCESGVEWLLVVGREPIPCGERVQGLIESGQQAVMVRQPIAAAE